MKMPTQEEPLVVVGAGLAGSLLSLYLARRGYETAVYESRADSREAGFVGGRSINLALSTRGLTALARVGMHERVLRECIPMHGRMIHDLAGNTQLQPYGKPGQYINSVSRQSLNEILMDAADEHDHIHFKFERKLKDLELEDGTPVFDHKGETERVPTRFLFGADGAYSAVRQAMMRSGRFDFSQSYLSHGYKELHIPPASDGGWQLYKNALHIWPRRDFMLIALPNLDGSFTVTLFLAWKGEGTSFEALQTAEDVEHFFQTHFPDARALMPDLANDFFENPTGSLVTIRCAPYHSSDQVLLVGDAAHAVVPFYGQGMNAAFEDCRILDEMLEMYAPDWGLLAQAFSKSRKPNADAIADLALYNYLEMRSKVADPLFLAKKRADTALHDVLDDGWMPLYSMVTFSNIPYAEVVERAQRQDQILKIGATAVAASVAAGLAFALSRR